MSFSPLIDQLINRLRCLPGVGAKTAQRMAFNLLERNREGGLALAVALEAAMNGVRRCESCRTLTEEPLCQICSNPRRDTSIICVVESPADVVAFEQSATYKGRYFVLMGHLSPIDGIGPEQIGIVDLMNQVKENNVQEVILATNTTVEGEATAHYISQQLNNLGVIVSRIAHGVPLGGELEYVDVGTLAHALDGRKVMQ